MFELSDETKASIIQILKTKLEVKKTDEEINAVLDEITELVKNQFGI